MTRRRAPNSRRSSIRESASGLESSPKNEPTTRSSSKTFHCWPRPARRPPSTSRSTSRPRASCGSSGWPSAAWTGPTPCGASTPRHRTPTAARSATWSCSTGTASRRSRGACRCCGTSESCRSTRTSAPAAPNRGPRSSSSWSPTRAGPGASSTWPRACGASWGPERSASTTSDRRPWPGFRPRTSSTSRSRWSRSRPSMRSRRSSRRPGSSAAGRSTNPSPSTRTSRSGRSASTATPTPGTWLRSTSARSTAPVSGSRCCSATGCGPIPRPGPTTPRPRASWPRRPTRPRPTARPRSRGSTARAGRGRTAGPRPAAGTRRSAYLMTSTGPASAPGRSPSCPSHPIFSLIDHGMATIGYSSCSRRPLATP